MSESVDRLAVVAATRVCLVVEYHFGASEVEVEVDTPAGSGTQPPVAALQHQVHPGFVHRRHSASRRVHALVNLQATVADE